MRYKGVFILLLFFALHGRGQGEGQGQQPSLPNRTQEPALSNRVDGDYPITRFPFQSGDTTLPQLRLHYITFGKPIRNPHGKVTNAILILHGTGSRGQNFINPTFGGLLFGPGQLLDASKYYLILPDGIGHGQSSKPSDGLHMRFPRYTYDDMVLAYYRLLTEHLQVDHLRLLMGTSMGAMHSWVWGYTYPGFMDALLPLASLPVAIAGRNRMMRKQAIRLIEMDPEWKGGEYTREPAQGLAGASSSLFFMNSSSYQLQEKAPTRKKADELLDTMEKNYLSSLDANDLIYQLDASRDYDPSPFLEKITAPLFAINSADDQINPPELRILEKEIKKVKKGRYILLPISDKTIGHGTNSLPSVWDNYLKELLNASAR